MVYSTKDFEWITVSVDEMGRVFQDKNYFYRGIYNQKSQLRRIDKLFKSGVIAELVKNELILPIEKIDMKFSDSDEFGMILRNRKIKNVIYPTEWSFSMLLQAANLMMKLEVILLKYGYTLLDYHPYNIVFEGTKAYHVDLGSIISADANSEQLFIKAMVEKYYRPLHMWSKKKKSITELYMFDRGISDREWDEYLYGIVLGNWIHKGKNFFKENEVINIQLLEEKFNNLIDFEREIEAGHHIDWSGYQDKFFQKDGRVKENKRFQIVAEFLKKYNVRTITELAANQGAFSQMCIEKDIISYSLAIDYDEWAIDKMYHRLLKLEKKLPISLGVVNIVWPMSRDHNDARKRMRNEAVVALALTHHLILSQGLTMEKTLDIIASYAEKYMFVEFMPLGLYSRHVSRGTKKLPKDYTIDHFRKIFEERCVLKEEVKISNNRVLFVGEIRQ